MSPNPLSWVVALDGGTTNTRARLLHEGEVVATARRSTGVRDAALAAPGEAVLAAAVRDAVREVLRAGGVDRPDAVVAAGMLTSEFGLVGVPHVTAPAGLDELAHAAVVRDMPAVSEVPILLIPGVKTPAADGRDGWAAADLMRGEECETLGALELRKVRGPLALLWPGSHTKLVAVDSDGRITASHTTLAGELTAAVGRHTLIARSLPESWPEHPDPGSAAAGARLALTDGIGRCAFLVRIAGLTGAMTPEQRAAFWVGAVVSDDAAHLARHPILREGVSLLIGGSQPLRGLYAAALGPNPAGGVDCLTDDEAEKASAAGAMAVCRRRAALSRLAGGGRDFSPD